MQVYFLVAEEHNYIKIGTTTQPRKRYSSHLSCCLPCTIYMIVIPKSPITELELLHKYAKDLYCQHEWFYSSFELYTEIQHMYENYNGYILSRLNRDVLVSRISQEKQDRIDAMKKYFSTNRINGHDIRSICK